MDDSDEFSDLEDFSDSDGNSDSDTNIDDHTVQPNHPNRETLGLKMDGTANDQKGEPSEMRQTTSLPTPENPTGAGDITFPPVNRRPVQQHARLTNPNPNPNPNPVERINIVPRPASHLPPQINNPELPEEVENNDSCDENSSRKRKARDMGKSICLSEDDDTPTFNKVKRGLAVGSGGASCSKCKPGPSVPEMISPSASQVVITSPTKLHTESILKELILYMMYLKNIESHQNQGLPRHSVAATGYEIQRAIAYNILFNPHYYQHLIRSPTFRQLVAHIVAKSTELRNNHQNHHDEDKGPTGQDPPN